MRGKIAAVITMGVLLVVGYLVATVTGFEAKANPPYKMITICYEGKTIEVPRWKFTHGDFPGATEGACPDTTTTTPPPTTTDEVPPPPTTTEEKTPPPSPPPSKPKRREARGCPCPCAATYYVYVVGETEAKLTYDKQGRLVNVEQR